MKCAVVKSANEPFVFENRSLPTPGKGELLVKVIACGVCHSDKLVAGALWPGLKLPRVPGHEIAGIVEEMGEGVTQFSKGDRVGLGWHGGHDGTCPACLQGKYVHCQNQSITGISIDGGYSEYVVASATAFARIPDGMDFAAAAPLLCAGVTTFNALRNSPARPGDVVAIQGLGGLGHLGVQFARAMGFYTVAVSRGPDKRKLSEELGAHQYIDAASQNIGELLGKVGGAKVILATAPNAGAISALVPGLGLDGQLLIVAAPFEPISVSAIDLIMRNGSIKGWASGSGQDSTDTMRFAKLHNLKPMIEEFPLQQAQKAYEHMMSGKVRFRSVIRMN